MKRDFMASKSEKESSNSSAAIISLTCKSTDKLVPVLEEKHHGTYKISSRIPRSKIQQSQDQVIPQRILHQKLEQRCKEEKENHDATLAVVEKVEKFEMQQSTKWIIL